MPVGRPDWIEAVRKDPEGFCDYDDYKGYKVSRTKIVSQLGCSLVTADKLKMILSPLVDRLNQLSQPERRRRYEAEQAAWKLKRETETVLEQAALDARRKEAEEREKAQRLKWIEDFRANNPNVKLPPMLQEWVEEYGVSENDISPQDPNQRPS